MKFLVAYIVGPGQYRGRWVEASNYDDARKKARPQIKAEGFILKNGPIALTNFQIDNPEQE